MDFILNSNQERLLIEVSKQTGKIPALKLGRRVYQTAVSGYNNIILLKDMGLVSIHRRHNTNIVVLTQRGIDHICNISKQSKQSKDL